MSFLSAMPMRAMQMPDRVAFTIGSIDVYWYGILLAAAIVTLILLTSAEAHRKALPQDTAVDLCLVAIPCGVVGARVSYIATNFAAYRNDFAGMLRFWDGGLSATGAVLLALAGVLVYALIKKLPFLRLLDAAAPGLVAAGAVAAWIDFFLQQRYGALVTNEQWMWFPFAVLIESSDSIHYAVFFYEFLLLALVFAFLWFILRKRAKADGTVTGTALLCYAVCRILTDFLRPDEPKWLGGFTVAQVVCAVLFALGLVLLLTRRATPVDDAEPAPANASVTSSAPTAADAAPEIVAEIPTAHASDANTEDATPAATEEPDAAPNTKEQE